MSCNRHGTKQAKESTLHYSGTSGHHRTILSLEPCSRIWRLGERKTVIV